MVGADRRAAAETQTATAMQCRTGGLAAALLLRLVGGRFQRRRIHEANGDRTTLLGPALFFALALRGLPAPPLGRHLYAAKAGARSRTVAHRGKDPTPALGQVLDLFHPTT